MQYKYYVQVNPFEYGEPSELYFSDFDKAIQFIQLGINHSDAGFYICKHEPTEKDNPQN